MADLLGGAVVDGVHHVAEEVSGIVFREVADRRYLVEEFSALAHVHHDVDVVLVFKPLVQSDDVGMVLPTRPTGYH